jgi:uncharacterized protein YjaG (DUF416 family)
VVVAEINKLKELDFNKQLAFAYLTCERLYPNYIYFSKNYDFGDPDTLRTALDYLYDNLFRYKIEMERIDSLVKKIDENIPEPANYDTILASSSLDACTVIIEALNFLADKKKSRLNDISIMATDTADMYIQEKEALDYNTDKDFQQKIDSHPLMKKEVATQKGIVSYLSNINNIEPSDIDILMRLQENDKGSLEL